MCFSSDTLEDDVEEVMVPEMSQDEDSTMEKEGSTKKNVKMKVI